MDLIQGTKVLFDQINTLLHQLDDTQYSKSISLLGGASLGKHMRHIINFYDCAFSGFSSGGWIDYSSRERKNDIESQIKIALEQFSRFAQQMDSVDLKQSISVKIDCFDSRQEIAHFVDSSMGRELMYAFDHAIHHLAIIKIGMISAFPQIPVDPNLGIAPSTLKYHAMGGK